MSAFPDYSKYSDEAESNKNPRCNHKKFALYYRKYNVMMHIYYYEGELLSAN